ncbi:MAG: hypothetical protein ACR2IH_09855 [Pyrinomonadaceae bacterium]
MKFVISLKDRGLYPFVTAIVIAAMLTITAPLAFAADTKYDVELVVNDGKKSVETDADIIFKEKTFTVVPDKKNFASSAKEIAYSDIKVADASFAKKPMLSGGGAVVTALLVGFIFALPFLFIKKKKHWMTVQTEKEFAVIKLGDNNFRQIASEFATHGVKVNDLGDESKNVKNDK